MDVRIWGGDLVEPATVAQMHRAANLPCVIGASLMADAHIGIGGPVGAVLATKGAIVPSVTGVDLGCGGIAQQLALSADDLPSDLHPIRDAIEQAVPHGRTKNGKRGQDSGAWHDIPAHVASMWRIELSVGHQKITTIAPKLQRANSIEHLGTLGTGNHFIEVCLDENNCVWVLLHSGSRGIGNAIGSHFIDLAWKRAQVEGLVVPDRHLAWLPEGTPEFDEYVEAVLWAQRFAYLNRQVMLEATVAAIGRALHRNQQRLWGEGQLIQCHHNYINEEIHRGSKVWITRKGALSAKTGELALIFGSMGVPSYIVRGKGNAASFTSCSHGAGRRMSRTQARETITLPMHRTAMMGIEARLDKDVIDESPAAYKPIAAVLAAQTDLIDVVHELKQVVNVKG